MRERVCDKQRRGEVGGGDRPVRANGAILEGETSLARLQRVTIDDLMKVDGVDADTAHTVKDTLERVTESTILDQYS